MPRGHRSYFERVVARYDLAPLDEAGLPVGTTRKWKAGEVIKTRDGWVLKPAAKSHLKPAGAAASAGAPKAPPAAEPPKKASVDHLPDDPARYFHEPEGSSRVDVSKLKTIRAREKGIANAAVHMANAYNGDGAKRKPVSLRALPDGSYEVCDGNSTTAIAKKHGWKQIIAKVADTCDAGH